MLTILYYWEDAEGEMGGGDVEDIMVPYDPGLGVVAGAGGNEVREQHRHGHHLTSSHPGECRFAI